MRLHSIHEHCAWRVRRCKPFSVKCLYLVRLHKVFLQSDNPITRISVSYTHFCNPQMLKLYVSWRRNFALLSDTFQFYVRVRVRLKQKKKTIIFNTMFWFKVPVICARNTSGKFPDVLLKIFPIYKYKWFNTHKCWNVAKTTAKNCTEVSSTTAVFAARNVLNSCQKLFLSQCHTRKFWKKIPFCLKIFRHPTQLAE